MPISDDLFHAILSLDAYNRGYNSGMGNRDSGLDGRQVGNAVLIAQSSSDAASIERTTSFFAQAYYWNGTTVISYCGTDAQIAIAP